MLLIWLTWVLWDQVSHGQIKGRNDISKFLSGWIDSWETWTGWKCSLTLLSHTWHIPTRTTANWLNLSKNISKPAHVFCFETMWICYPLFSNIVKHHWNNNPNYIHAIFSFTKHVEEWNRTTFGNIYIFKRNLLARIMGLQNMDPLHKSNFHINLENNLIHEYNLIL